MRQQRDAVGAHAGRVMDGAEDGRGRRHQRGLADSLGARGTERLAILDQEALDLRHVAHGRNEIVVQVLGAAGQILLHQREAQPLRHAALDLALDERRIDRPADIVRGHDAQDLHRAQLDIDFDFGQLRGESIGRIGHALPIGIERRGRRIEGAFAHQRTGRGEIDGPHVGAIAHRERRAVERQDRLRSGIGQPQDLLAQILSGLFRRLARHEGLAGGRGLAGIGGQIGVARHQLELFGGETDRIGGDLHHDGVAALTDVERATVERQGAARRQADPHARGVRHRGVADSVPHAADADAAAMRTARLVEGGDFLVRLPPMRPQCFETLREAGGMRERLACRRRIAGAQGVAMPELQPVEAKPVGEFIHHRFMRDGRLRYAEAAEGAGRRSVGEEGFAPGPHVGDGIGPHRMHRHAVGDGRAPGRIGTGVEQGGHVTGEQLALGIAADPRRHSGRMALGAGGHAFGPRVDQSHGPLQLPRCDADQRLNRKVELAAEAAAAGGRHDAHRLGLQPHQVGDLVAVHVGRLGGGVDLDPVANPARPAGLGLDIGVLDERRLERAFGHRGAILERSRRVTALHPALQQQVARPVGLHQWRTFRHGGIDAEQRRLGPPGDRHLVVADRQHFGPLADQGDDRFAAIADMPVREHRLILDVGIDAVAIERHVRGRQHCRESAPQRLEITQLEARPRVRRAHDPDPQRVRWNAIGAEHVAPVDLGRTIDPHDSRPDGFARRRCARRRRGDDIHHRIDDLAVAGAAAEHAAQSVLDLGPARLAVPPHQFLGGHQHAGRADAALGRAMIEERLLERGHRIASTGETFHRLDAAARDLAHGHEAGTNLAPIQQDGAGAAIAGIAADLRAGQTEIVAQRRSQPRDRRTVPACLTSVESEFKFQAATFDRRRRSKTKATSLR